MAVAVFLLMNYLSANVPDFTRIERLKSLEGLPKGALKCITGFLVEAKSQAKVLPLPGPIYAAALLFSFPSCSATAASMAARSAVKPRFSSSEMT